jgi:hypothetical protein
VPTPAATPPPTAAPAPDKLAAPNLKLEASDLQSKRMARLAKSSAALVGRLGPRGAGHRQSLKPYLALAQQSERLSSVMERGDDDLQRKELSRFRDALSRLEKNYKPADFFSLLDEFPSDEPEVLEIRSQTGIEPIDPLVGSEILPSAKLEVIGRTGRGKRAKVAGIHHRGYQIDGEVVRRPRVDLVFDDVKRPPRRNRVWWAAVALAALLVAALAVKPGRFKRVAEAAVGEPVLSVWSVPGARLLVARGGYEQLCSLRIWQAPQWESPVVLPAPCAAAAAVSPDGNLAAWSSDNGLPTIIKTNNVPLRTMGPQERHHTGTITALGFSPDGRFLYSAATDGYVRMWNVQTGEYEKDLADPEGRLPFQSLLVAGNGLVAAGEATSGARIKVWFPGREHPFLLEGAGQAIAVMAYDAQAGLFFAGTADGEILIWQLRDYPEGSSVQPGWRERPASDKTQAIALAPGARLFVSFPHSVFSWHYANAEMTLDEPFSFGTVIAGVATVSDGKTTFLATGEGGDDHSIGIWRIAQ